MGNGMNKVLPGLFVGNYRDSKDPQQLARYKITHILAIHDSPRRLLPDKHYLCVMAADTPDQNLSQYFTVCNDFIHAARLRDGNVLIHCLAGMSRSVTVAVAYIMSVTPLTWKEALKVVRAGRAVANPNLGFQTQLQDFELTKLIEERKRLKERFPSVALSSSDNDQCSLSLNNYAELLSNRSICEGSCNRGVDCPTGLCRSDSTKGIFRRKTSTSSSKSRLSISSASNTTLSQSCPTSPRYANRTQRSLSRPEPCTSSSLDSNDDTRITLRKGVGNGLQRSASTVSHNFQRPANNPSGLYSYTGSAPPSVHGSRIDLSTATNTGSAIYLGFSQPRNTYTSGSTWSISKIASSGGSGPPTPINTPPVSPRHGSRRLSSRK